ncbi:MAG TPA: hypothetical protein VKZ18_14950 [Polyangia bacterium]|nr:hypothetical protein [Polyangia bacterium]
MRSSRALLLAALVAGALGAGCSSPESFVVLALESTSTPITSVEQITVVVTQGAQTKTLTYPASSLTFLSDANPATIMGTLSIGFSGSQSGDVHFDVTVYDARGCATGNAQVLVTIRRGASVEALVQLAPEESCTGDAGAPDLQPGSTFPGCDPTGSAVCPSGQSCQVDCVHRANVCATAGQSAPGGSCANNAGCAAGSQCFDYTSLGCPTQVCLRLCGSNTDCAALSTGIGPGSFCRDPVACGSVTTAYKTCAFSCDPTATAAASGVTGCPTGLSCVIPASMDQVDCACAESTRTGKEGATCSSTAQCAPGFLCEQTCRAVCRCDAQNGACTATSACPTTGTSCRPVSGQTIYGVCL